MPGANVGRSPGAYVNPGYGVGIMLGAYVKPVVMIIISVNIMNKLE